MLTPVLVVLAVALTAWAVRTAVRRVRTPPELRGDWWPEFERQFRAYASRSANRDRQRRHHRGEPA